MAKHKPSGKRRKKRRLRVGRLIVLILILFMLVLGGVYAGYRSSLKPVSSTGEDVVFTVNSGESLKTVSENLQSEKLVRNALFAAFFAKTNNLSDVKAGDYTLNPSMSVDEIFTTLNDATAAIADEDSVTIIEGDWTKNVAQKIAEKTQVSADDLLALWNDSDYLHSLMDKYPFLTEDIFNADIRHNLEGYLCPDTYTFYRTETDPKVITEKILDQTLAVYNKYADGIASNSYGLTIHEIYTLASIVQYESGNPEDMAKIAQVFYNRLQDGMALQSSVTVCYALDADSGEDWKQCEYNPDVDSPYNTYLHTGLPPGPIVNPGEDAIQAVLNPNTDYVGYYYFMADVDTGTVYYARTLEEHNANVALYGKA